MHKKTTVFQTNGIILALLTFAAFFACSLTFADGASRKPTPVEKDFTKLILNTFAKAVPPGPAGWDKTPDSTEIADLQVVYSGEKDPLQVSYRIEWQDTKRIQEAEMKLQEELIKLAQKPGFKGEGVDELQQKMSPHDVKVRIDISANLTSQGIYEKVAPAAAIAGGLTYRGQGYYRSSWNEGSAYVFFGKNWKMTSSSSGGTYIDFKPEKRIASSTAVQSIVVRVQADPARGQQYIEKIDWDSLKKLIRN